MQGITTNEPLNLASFAPASRQARKQPSSGDDAEGNGKPGKPKKKRKGAGNGGRGGRRSGKGQGSGADAEPALQGVGASGIVTPAWQSQPVEAVLLRVGSLMASLEELLAAWPAVEEVDAREACVQLGKAAGAAEAALALLTSGGNNAASTQPAARPGLRSSAGLAVICSR